MAANTATISALHADGVVKDGDKLFNYSYIQTDPTVLEAYDVLIRRHNSASKPVVVIVKKTVNGTAVTDSTQYVKSAEFLRDLKARNGIVGSYDAMIESIAAQAMTAAELIAAGTPVDSQLPTLPSAIDMPFETYTSNTIAGYLRVKASAVAAVAAPVVTVAADPATGVDWTTILTWGGIGALGLGAAYLLYKAFKKKPRSKKK